jgi:hypothetical protein
LKMYGRIRGPKFFLRVEMHDWCVGQCVQRKIPRCLYVASMEISRKGPQSKCYQAIKISHGEDAGRV